MPPGLPRCHVDGCLLHSVLTPSALVPQKHQQQKHASGRRGDVTPPLPLHNSGTRGVQKRASTPDSLLQPHSRIIHERASAFPPGRGCASRQRRGQVTHPTSVPPFVLVPSLVFVVSLVQTAAGKLLRSWSTWASGFSPEGS